MRAAWSSRDAVALRSKREQKLMPRGDACLRACCRASPEIAATWPRRGVASARAACCKSGIRRLPPWSGAQDEPDSRFEPQAKAAVPHAGPLEWRAVRLGPREEIYLSS